MTGTRLGWNELLFGALLVTAAALAGVPPAVGLHLPLLGGSAMGVAAGSLLYRALAGSWGPFSAPTQVRGTLLSWPGAILAMRAVLEELAWRGFLLGALAGPITPLPALVVTSVLFALAHTNAEGRRRLVHVATGGAFGSVYLLTGQLAAAAAAHIAYNGLIAVSRKRTGDRHAA